MELDLSGISNQSMVGKFLRMPLSLIPKTLILPILQGPLRGKRWIVGSCTHGCWLGSYEFEKQRLFARTIRPDHVVYDIGANVGYFTLLASLLVGSNGKVVAFEPLPRNIEYLKKHLTLNHCKNVQIFICAVSDHEGRAFFDPSHNRSMGHLSDTGTLEVETVALDELALHSQIPLPDVIKIDVEGAEEKVLSGGQSLIKDHKPIIFLATHGLELHRRCCHWLKENGYRLIPLGGAIEESDEILAVPEGMCEGR